jgi:hypothetical protein
MISLDSQHILVESGVLDLSSCAMPVVPELGGKAGESTLRLGRRRPRLYPRTPLSEIIAAPPVLTPSKHRLLPPIGAMGRKP